MRRFFGRKPTVQAAAGGAPAAPVDPIDYESVTLLDAEELAEGGIEEAYATLIPVIARYVPQPWVVRDVLDNDAPRYAVDVNGREMLVYDPDTAPEDSWGRAAAVLFSAVNGQLRDAPVTLFALNEGNGLAGVLLTPTAAAQARRALPRRADWPYLPTVEAPWFGQPH